MGKEVNADEFVKSCGEPLRSAVGTAVAALRKAADMGEAGEDCIVVSAEPLRKGGGGCLVVSRNALDMVMVQVVREIRIVWAVMDCMMDIDDRE